MSAAIQQLIVAALVAGAALYAGWQLAPAHLRLKCARRLLELTPARAPATGWLQRLLSSVAYPAGERLAPGCARCPAGPNTHPRHENLRRPS